MTRLRVEASGPVTDEGEQVRARRERLGLSMNQLAKSAAVSRDTISAIEAGQGFHRSSLTKIERALEIAEDEYGITAPPPTSEKPHVIVVRLTDPQGWQVAVEGPITDRAELEETARRLIRSLADD